MHHRPFEGRHLVCIIVQFYLLPSNKNHYCILDSLPVYVKEYKIFCATVPWLCLKFFFLKASAEDLQRQNQELERGVSELRGLLEDASQQYGGLERAKEQQAREAEDMLQKKEEAIKDLKDQLDKVNLLLQANAKKGRNGV